MTTLATGRRRGTRGNWSVGALIALWILAGPLARGAAQTGGVLSDQQLLIQLERDWNAAFYAKDLAFIEQVLADEFVVTYPDGSRGDKAKELALAAEFNQRVDSITLDEFTVRIYGDSAVVWFSLHLVGPRQGKPATVSFRYVDVFVRREGRWQCVASQSTRVAS
jgi:ketosteroid isomerase-like protein